jgi:hypothetical protein
MNSNTLIVDEVSTIINSGNLNAVTAISPHSWSGTITTTAPLPYELEVIQGKLLQCHYEMSSYDMHTGGSYQLEPDYIKKKLTEMVIDKLLKDDLIYFTKIDNPVSDSARFIARLGVLEKDKTEFVAKKLRKT